METACSGFLEGITILYSDRRFIVIGNKYELYLFDLYSRRYDSFGSEFVERSRHYFDQKYFPLIVGVIRVEKSFKKNIQIVRMEQNS